MTDNYYKYHVFICLNQREDGYQCCTQFNSEKIFEYMKQKIKKLNLRGQGLVRINRSGCFDRCALGPLLVIYPDAVWYNFIDESDIDEIIESHIMNQKPVQRLVV